MSSTETSLERIFESEKWIDSSKRKKRKISFYASHCQCIDRIQAAVQRHVHELNGQNAILLNTVDDLQATIAVQHTEIARIKVELDRVLAEVQVNEGGEA